MVCGVGVVVARRWLRADSSSRARLHRAVEPSGFCMRACVSMYVCTKRNDAHRAHIRNIIATATFACSRLAGRIPLFPSAPAAPEAPREQALFKIMIGKGMSVLNCSEACVRVCNGGRAHARTHTRIREYGNGNGMAHTQRNISSMRTRTTRPRA